MNYLMDTHTLIWSITEKEKLSPLVRQTLENPANSIFVSAITFWEISLKFSKGKLELNEIVPEDFPKLSLQTGFQLLPLNADESASYHKLALTDHKDPFDRMLIWQAINRNFILITKGSQTPQYSEFGLKTLW